VTRDLSPVATIALLTRNSEKNIKKVLDGIKKQSFKDYEILLIDTSSTDETLTIAKQYNCKIVVIKPEEFGHGKTRNYAAKLANGEFLVFLTHDSVPKTESWLNELLKPFEDKKIAGTYGRQIPRNDEKLLDKYFQKSLYGSKDTVWTRNNWKQGDNIFSDANSALRKKILLKYPYANGIIVSEDYEWATRILKLGYKIKYNVRAKVIHSHSYNLRSLFRRNFDVGVSYRVIYDKASRNGFRSKGIAILKEEVLHLKKTNNSLFIPRAITRDVVRFIAIQLGLRENIIPKLLKRNYLSAQKGYWK
jgi:rhamnosyltransferase